MFEKGEKSKPNLWVERRFVSGLEEAGIEFRVYLASALYPTSAPDQKQAYGRHAALKAMRDLANADLVRFTIERITQLEMILAELMTAQQCIDPAESAQVKPLK